MGPQVSNSAILNPRIVLPAANCALYNTQKMSQWITVKMIEISFGILQKQ